MQNSQYDDQNMVGNERVNVTLDVQKSMYAAIQVLKIACLV